MFAGDPPTPEEFAAAEVMIDQWVDAEAESNPIIDAVDRGEPGEHRWYIRVKGDEKDVFTIWFTLRQRTLQYETYVMPAPEENEAEFYAHLLRRNLKLHGAQFAIGEEDAVFLTGAWPIDHLSEAELDRILGTMYISVEEYFRPALRIGFASRMAAGPK